MTIRTAALQFTVLVATAALMSGCSDSPTTGGSGGQDVMSDGQGAGQGSSDGESAQGDAVLDDAALDDAAVASDTDGLSVFPSDLPVISADQIKEDVDLSEFFPDAVGPDPDTSPDPEPCTLDDECATGLACCGPDTVKAGTCAPVGTCDEGTGDGADASTGDATEMSDAPGSGDAVSDAAGPDDTSADDAGVQDPDTFLADCENMGVEPGWAGTFDGAIEYHIPEALETLFSPPDGILIVGGSLSFEIACVDSKLIVSGDMDGTANVSGEGNFPFQVKLAGYFNPTTGYLNATMVEGKVVLYEVAEIYFSGDFTGTLVDGVFDGQWEGHYDGSNFPLPPGDEPVADGLGTWTTTPTDTE